MAADRDAAAMAAIYAPFCGTGSAVSFEVVPPSADEMAARVKMITAQFPWLVADDNGTVAGYVYAGRHSERAAYGWSVNVAVYIADAYRKRGVGKALYSALFGILRLQGYFKACAGITMPNPGSIALHEAMGFTRVGVYHGIGYKNGAWHDVAWYEMKIQPERESPATPRSVSDVIGSPEFAQALSRGV